MIRLAWIFGSSRSGSTWLLRMLGELDPVVPVDDPHLGHHLGVWRPIPLAWATAREPSQLRTLHEIKRHKPDYFFSDAHRDAWEPALRDLILARFEAQAGASGGVAEREPMVVVKEPGSHVADLLLSLFPRSCLIFLLRDGRDVVDSWIDAYQRGSWALDEGAYEVTREGRLPLVRWLSSVWVYRTEVVLRAYRHHDRTRRALIRYEDLLADPARELATVASALSLEAPPGRLETIAEKHSYHRVSPHERGEGKEIRAARPGDWRRNLDAREREAMAAVMYDQLVELGYERGERPTPDGALDEPGGAVAA